MEFLSLHEWTLDRSEAVDLQRKLAATVIGTDRLDEPLSLVAGVDVSCRWHGNLFHAAVVVLSFPELAVQEIATATLRVEFPYIPGLLSFRELPVILQAFTGLILEPQLVLVDGQGIAHPRGLGLASHLGLWLDLPTIGCAKSRLYGEHDVAGEFRGDQRSLRSPQGAAIGSLLTTKDRVKPLYVSPGHLLSIERAVELVLACGSGYRLPEPTRAAHNACNEQRIRVEETISLD